MEKKIQKQEMDNERNIKRTRDRQKNVTTKEI
jgi:hypothetical protein